MKSVVLPAYNKNILRAILSLEIQEKELPKLNDDEVLIKTHAAPVNPSDVAFIQGGYNIVKQLPAVPGFEGSGVIVDAGKNANDLIKKKVSAFVQTNHDGSWAEYFVARKKDLIILQDDMDMDQAACFTVNPFTAYALMEIALIRESKAIVQNAAGAQVAALFRTMARENEMEVINIVRKAETAALLKQQGIQHVLNQTDDSFEKELKSLSSQLHATTAFDAVGGELTGQMFNAMADDSELVVYGGLSGKPLSGIGLMGVIFKNKIISGFNLMDWKRELDTSEFEQVSDELQDKIISGIYKTEIQETVGLDQIVQGLKTYLGNMSGGKILIKP
jgi:NADPH:quinone reductase-like Zn-dependent oxidoreductase